MKRWLSHGTDLVPTEISLDSIGLVLIDVAIRQLGLEDDLDAICEWTVDRKGRVLVEDEEFVTSDPRIALLVRCSHLLRKGELLP